MTLEFSRQILEKYLSIKFNENPSICKTNSAMRTDRRKDGRDKGNTNIRRLTIQKSAFLIIFAAET
jgi:hypothetical protein